MTLRELYLAALNLTIYHAEQRHVFCIFTDEMNVVHGGFQHFESCHTTAFDSNTRYLTGNAYFCII